MWRAYFAGVVQGDLRGEQRSCTVPASARLRSVSDVTCDPARKSPYKHEGECAHMNTNDGARAAVIGGTGVLVGRFSECLAAAGAAVMALGRITQ